MKWIENQLDLGVMRNERHLWSSVRPNGPKRPYDLNRLELRICDLITDVDLLLAITALLELRILSLFNKMDEMDPLKVSLIGVQDLVSLCDENDCAVAHSSLNAKLYHWKNGREINCVDWIQQIIDEVTPLAIDLNMIDLLKPIHFVLSKGNQAMRWLHSYSSGMSIEAILKESMIEMELEEKAFMKSKVIL